jgi:GNAT superfamily N-acetyltransferase
MEQKKANDIELIRQKLAGKRIHVFSYCHADWAWCLSRRWHEARYVRVLDDVLELAEKDSRFKFFADSYVAFFPPFAKSRPEALERLRLLVKENRFGITGGSYSDARPTTTPEETYIRNLEMGRQAFEEMFPGIQISGFANLDTAVGHSQLPQVLKLAGYDYYLAGRPEFGMKLEGFPKVFRWIGKDGSEIPTGMQHYGGMIGPVLQLKGFQDADWREFVTGVWKVIEGQAEISKKNIYVFYAGDDMRPGMRSHDDRSVELAKIFEQWNSHETSTMEYATPDGFYRSVKDQLDSFPAVGGALDQADVGFNGPFGQEGLRELRDRAGMKLVEAEIYSGWGTLYGESWPEELLRDQWRNLLKSHSHGGQFLCGDDIAKIRLELMNVIRTGEELIDSAAGRIFPFRLPHESSAVAIFSSFPRSHRRMITLPVVRADYQVPRYCVTDEEGKMPPQQAVQLRVPHKRGEWDLLVDVELPACGYRKLKWMAAEKTPEFAEPVKLQPECEIPAGPFRIRWKDGLIVSISLAGKEFSCSGTSSFFEPVHYPLKFRGWMVTELLSSGAIFEVTQVRQTEFGPLRWAWERTGKLKEHRIQQTIYVYDSGRIECHTQVNYGAEGCFLGLAFPCRPESRLLSSVPFGTEEREIEKIAYHRQAVGEEIIERLIPGMFYARDWVQVTEKNQAVGVAVLDGDRYWYRPKDQAGLIHFLVRTLPPFTDGWERLSEMGRAGYSEFRHVLVLGEDTMDPGRLDDIADQNRMGTHIEYTDEMSGSWLRNFLRIEGENIRMLSCRMVADVWEIRMVENAGRPTTVRVKVSMPITAATMTDFLGNPLKISAVLHNQEVQVQLNPWQIGTLRMKPGVENSMIGKVIGEVACEEIREDDILPLLTFYQTLSSKIIRSFHPYGVAITENVLCEGPFSRLSRGDEYGMVIRDRAGNIWGHAFLQRVLSKRPGFGIGIHQNLLGQGMGKKLMKALFEGAEKKLDLEWIDLNVYENNTAACELYRSMGFDVIGEKWDENTNSKVIQMRKVKRP